jgi:long-chain acyl-CoA synthetase
MVGDRHKFLSALIAPNFSVLEAWAREQGIQAASRAELVINARVQALYDGLIREVNKTLANFQTIKRFRLVPDEWTQESGELTPSLKLKRRIVNARYAAEIAEFYADEATASGGSAS